MNRAATQSDLAFLRMLQLVHQQTSLLVEDLKAYEVSSVIPRSPSDMSDFNLTLNSASTSAVSTTAATVSTMLETAMEELFVPYTEGQRYLDRESKSLSELYARYLSLYTRFHVSSSFLPRCSLWVLISGGRNASIKGGNRQCLIVWSTS